MRKRNKRCIRKNLLWSINGFQPRRLLSLGSAETRGPHSYLFFDLLPIIHHVIYASEKIKEKIKVLDPTQIKYYQLASSFTKRV